MNIAVTPPHTVAQAIEAHRQAIDIDESSFFNGGWPKSVALADRTGAAEIVAYLAMISAPCATVEDVQLKLHYILNGSVGERMKLVECLDYDEYGGVATLQAFLHSLLLAAAAPEAQTP
ncbi:MULTISPECIES: hypothetical protein [unclassified Rhizobium]|uniref:hypothetical protein n=1 Tax=unclassified Rhizobium TaxID=2613769 RepID=UPI0012E365E2|nr:MULTISPECIES: hypothetical protein [unclassified Rhizobium]